MGTLILFAMSNEHMNMMHMSLFKSCYQIGPMFKLMLIRSVANGHIHRQTCLRIIRQSFTVVLLNSMIFASDSESSGNFLNVALLSSQYQSQILGRNLRAPCLSIYHILTSSHPWSLWKPVALPGLAEEHQWLTGRLPADLFCGANRILQATSSKKKHCSKFYQPLKTLQAAVPRLADLKDITCISPSIAIFWSFNPSIPFRDGFGSLSPWQASFGTK